MGVTALLMAGGRGTRMDLPEEKPLVRVGGKAMIEHIIDALKGAGKVDEIVVTVSKHTPKTAEVLKGLTVQVLETPGKDYIEDVKYAVKRLNLNAVLTISADLPLVSSPVLDEVVERFERSGKPALAVAVPAETRERLGLKTDYLFELRGKRLVPVGINVIDGKKIDEGEIEEETLVIDRGDLAVNVNTPKDLEVAQRLFNKLRRPRKGG